MGKAIVVGVVLLAAIIFIGIFAIRWRRQRYRQDDKIAGRAVSGDMNARQERALISENDKIADLVRELLAPANSLMDEIPYVPIKLRTNFQEWLKNHDREKGLRW